jgi:hypothetical protein
MMNTAQQNLVFLAPRTRTDWDFRLARRYNVPIHKTQHNALPANTLT